MPAAPEPIKQEVLAKAVLGTDRAGVSAEARMAGAVEQLIAKGQPMAALELGKKTPVERAKLERQREEIGVNRDTTGTKLRTGDEVVRYDAISDANELHLAYLEKGVDGLTAGQQGMLFNVVEQAILTRPALAMEFQAEIARGTPKATVLKNWLTKNPKVAEEMRKGLQTLSNEKGLPDTVTPAKEKLDMAQIDLDTAKDDSDSVSKRYTTVENHLKSYDRDANGIGVGANALLIDSLQKDLPKFHTDKTAAEAAFRNANGQMASLVEEMRLAATIRGGISPLSGKDLATLRGEYAAAQSAASTAQTAIDTNQDKINQLDRLKADEQNLETKRIDLEGEKRQKDAEVKKKELDFQKRQREYQDELKLRASAEDDLVYKFEHVADEAVTTVLDERIVQLHGKLQEQLENLKKEAKTADDQTMINAIERYWLDTPKKRTRGIIHRRTETYTPLDENKVESSYATLMNPDPAKGPIEVMKQLLKSQVNPATNHPYTEAEAATVLKDPEYVARMQPEVVKHLLARKFLVGGISKADARNIVLAPWGKDMIAQALELKKDVATQVEALMGEGALSQVGFFEKLLRNIEEHPVLLILILLGGGIAGIGGLALGVAGFATLGGSSAAGTLASVGIGKAAVAAVAAAGIGSVGSAGVTEVIGAALRHEE